MAYNTGHRGFLVGLSILLLGFSKAFAYRVDTLQVYSKAMKKQIPNVVVLPDAYASSKQVMPVLYLLHGAYGSYKDWVTKAKDWQGYVDAYNMIVVCPDGGHNSWYFDSPIDPAMRYETYIAKELIQAVDSAYRTIKNKAGRAIVGQSMGGHGAFYLSLKHQDLWGAAGSMSGAVDIRPFPDSFDINQRLGAYAEYPERWEKNTVINLSYLINENSPQLIFDCGTEDFLYRMNKSLHELLLSRNVPHHYIERPGGHTWDYWTIAIRYQLLFFSDFFHSQAKVSNAR